MSEKKSKADAKSAEADVNAKPDSIYQKLKAASEAGGTEAITSMRPQIRNAILAITALVMIGSVIYESSIHRMTSGSITATAVHDIPPSPCPEYVFGEHRSCTFGDQVRWASMGTNGGYPCQDRVASPDDFSESTQDGPSASGMVSFAKGFAAPLGQTRIISYWKAASPEDCTKT